jgi:hypothetical protein
MANSLGRLVVQLDANIARFEKSLTKAEHLMAQRTRAMQNAYGMSRKPISRS